MCKKKVLVTGFDPFGGEKINPALECVKRLSGYSTKSFEIITCEIPTVFDQSIERLIEHIERTQPDIVLSIGQAGGRSDLSFERIAINLNDARIADNQGNQPIDTEIIPNGPIAYWTKLPVKSIVSTLQENGIPCSISHSAGTFVCNHLFYGLMHYIHVYQPNVTGGFVHIPFLPEQIVATPQKPSMSIETITSGILLAIEVATSTTLDIKRSGGSIY